MRQSSEYSVGLINVVEVLVFTTGNTVGFRICFVDQQLKPRGSGVLCRVTQQVGSWAQARTSQLSALCPFSEQTASGFKGWDPGGF